MVISCNSCFSWTILMRLKSDPQITRNTRIKTNLPNSGSVPYLHCRHPSPSFLRPSFSAGPTLACCACVLGKFGYQVCANPCRRLQRNCCGTNSRSRKRFSGSRGVRAGGTQRCGSCWSNHAAALRCPSPGLVARVLTCGQLIAEAGNQDGKSGSAEKVGLKKDGKFGEMQ